MSTTIETTAPGAWPGVDETIFAGAGEPLADWQGTLVQARRVAEEETR